MNNLGMSYKEEGRLREAIALLEPVVEKSKAMLGPDHPDTLGSMNGLAHAYYQVGRWREAIALLEPVVEKRKAKFGPDHPDTLGSMNCLASAYLRNGKPDQALPVYEQILKLREGRQGPEHTDTLDSMEELASAYGDTGKLDKAIPLLGKTIELRRAKQGLDHPQTLRSMARLGVTYWQARKFDRSIPLFEELVKLQTTKLGKDHADTLTDMANLAVNYRDAGRLQEGVQLFEEAFERARKLKPFPQSLAWVGVELAKSRSDPAQVAADYAKLIDVIPSETGLWTDLWEAYFRSKQWDTALRHYAQAIEQKPDGAFGWFGRGMTFAERGEWEKATADLSRAAGLKDAPVYVQYYQALLRLRAGDADGYRDICTDMLKRWGTSDFWTLWTCVLAPNAVGDPMALANGAEKAVGKEPKDLMTANLLGAALYRAGRYDEAARQLTRASGMDPGPVRTNLIYTWFFLAMTHHRLGHAPQARQWLDKAIQATDRALDPSATPAGGPPRGASDPAGGIPPAWNRRLTLELLRREAVGLLKVETAEPELAPLPQEVP
jgi:tetratricopeptide (TPR) repeat protein